MTMMLMPQKNSFDPWQWKPLDTIKSHFHELGEWNPETIQSAIERALTKLGVGYGKIGLPLRVAVTGTGASPALDQTLALLGKEKTLSRIERAIDFIEHRRQSNS